MTTKHHAGGMTVDKYDLASAYEQVLEHERERSAEDQAPADPPRSERGKAVLAAILCLISAYLWLGQPDWIRPPADPVPSELEIDQGQALGLRLQAAQIEAYRTRTGHLPTSLADLEPIMPGIEFHPDGQGGFELEALGGANSIRLQSTDADEALESVGMIGATP